MATRHLVTSSGAYQANGGHGVEGEITVLAVAVAAAEAVERETWREKVSKGDFNHQH